MDPPDGVDLDALDGLTLADRGVVIEDTLIVADLHLGRGAAANLQVPVGNGADVIDRLETLLDRHDPAELVLAGDVIHEFGTVTRPVKNSLEGIQSAAADRDVDVVAIVGNHDTHLASAWDGETRAEYRLGETVVCHGHEPPSAEADRYLVGHDHPSISIEGQRRACYLAGDGVYEGADLVMLPAFNRIIRGVEVNDMSARDFQSPLIRSVDDFAPVVWDDASEEPLVFPPLGTFRHRL